MLCVTCDRCYLCVLLCLRVEFDFNVKPLFLLVRCSTGGQQRAPALWPEQRCLFTDADPQVLFCRSQIQEQPAMAAVLAALCPNLHRDLGLSGTGEEVLPQIMQQLRNMQ